MQVDLWIPVVSTLVTTAGIIWQAKINRQNKPVRDILQRTKLEGNGSLVEAMGALSKEYQDSLTRNARETKYFMEQLAEARERIAQLQRAIDAKDTEILILEKKVAEHEARLNAHRSV